jgi:hypothetical protein
VADPKFLPKLVDQIAKTAFAGKPFKMLSLEGGKLTALCLCTLSKGR